MIAKIKNILAAILVAIVIFLLMNHHMRYFLFNTIMGRALMLLIIMCITCLNMALGLVLVIIILGLHATHIDEGFIGGANSSSSSSLPSNPIDNSSSSSSSIESFAVIKPYNSKNAKKYNGKIDKISAEMRVRPKSSKSLPTPLFKKNKEPSANEGFSSYSAF